jgi:hypothetical protein
MVNAKDKKRLLAADALAEVCEGEGFDKFARGPCACLGSSCGDITCPAFWNFLLNDPIRLRKALKITAEVYQILKEE